MEAKPRLFLTAAILSGLSAAPASAALLLYEGFNYTAPATLDTITPNGSTVGLATTGSNASYDNASGSNSPTNLSVLADGLTFGSLSTSGGRVATTGTNVSSVITNSTTTSDIIWGSYLVNLGSRSTSGNNGMDIRLNSTYNSDPNSSYFRSDADARYSSASVPAVSYGLDLTVADAVLETGTIYYIVNKFDSSGTGGSATTWALDSAQFEAFVTAGRTEAYLNGTGNVITTATATTATADKGWDGAYLEFVTANISVTFDEIRYGETLLDVAPIPEPSAALLGLAGTSLLLRRRRSA